MKKLKYVGMDVHKETISLAVFSKSGNTPEIVTKIMNNEASIKRFYKKLLKEARIKACYEAGFSGFALQRFLDKLGIDCVIAAPGRIPKKPTDRIKTDKRDAVKLARLLRSGEIEAIYIPAAQYEAVRGYLRARDDMRLDLIRNKHRTTQFLLRYGYSYNGKKWSAKHREWLNNIAIDDPVKKMTFDHYYCQVRDLEEQIRCMDSVIKEIAECEPFADSVAKLRCFKGIDYLTAMFMICEVVDFNRFRSAEAFMSYVGMIPGEYSSGPKRRQRGITKTGNGNIRRLLTEAAWQYRFNGPVGKTLTARRRGQPADFVAYAEKARKRLTKKYRKFLQRGKSQQVTVTAIGRELAGFIWGSMVGQTA